MRASGDAGKRECGQGHGPARHAPRRCFPLQSLSVAHPLLVPSPLLPPAPAPSSSPPPSFPAYRVGPAPSPSPPAAPRARPRPSLPFARFRATLKLRARRDARPCGGTQSSSLCAPSEQQVSRHCSLRFWGAAGPRRQGGGAIRNLQLGPHRRAARRARSGTCIEGGGPDSFSPSFPLSPSLSPVLPLLPSLPSLSRSLSLPLSAPLSRSPPAPLLCAHAHLSAHGGGGAARWRGGAAAEEAARADNALRMGCARRVRGVHRGVAGHGGGYVWVLAQDPRPVVLLHSGPHGIRRCAGHGGLGAQVAACSVAAGTTAATCACVAADAACMFCPATGVCGTAAANATGFCPGTIITNATLAACTRTPAYHRAPLSLQPRPDLLAHEGVRGS